MPLLDIGDCKLYYELEGSKNAPTLLFSNSLGTTLAMWEPQLATLIRDFSILRYDTRGHGKSSVTPGPYSIDQLANDVLQLLDRLSIPQVDFCGLSMGGMTGMSLAIRVPQRLRKLVLCNTAPRIGSADVWNTRIETVRKGGMPAVVEGVLDRWFMPSFRSASPAAVESTRQMLLNTPVDGYIANCAAVRDMDARESISRIGMPTLIICGTHDPVVSIADNRLIEQKIRGAQFKELSASHLSNIEAAEAFNMELVRFLKA